MKILASVLAAVLTLALLEGGLRVAEVGAPAQGIAATPEAMMESLPKARIRGREVGTQLLVHNIAWLARHPKPATVTSAFVGTSRTKVLRPQWFGTENAVNAAGNSYNDISYGLLLQMEALRLRFPNLKTVYVEASYLLRRPAGLRLEEDHRQYIPLLEAVLPLQQGLPTGGDDFRQRLAQARQGAEPKAGRSALLAHRSGLRLTGAPAGEEQGIPVLQDKWLAGLRENGEPAVLPGRELRADEQRPEVGPEHIKVQRLRPVAGWYPWDGLFDMAARWGDRHGILVVFFQPPVRSDLYRFKRELGIERHVADLKRVAQQYRKPFIDLNLPDAGFQQDGSLFTDEDHAGTCRGVVLLHAGIEDGLRQYHAAGELLPVVRRADLEARYARQLKLCAASA